MRLWAIRHTSRTGSTWIDYTCIYGTRRDCWRAFDERNHGATPGYLKELTRKRRKGLIRAVKVVVKEVSNG
jgi:hypothetical protein